MDSQTTNLSNFEAQNKQKRNVAIVIGLIMGAVVLFMTYYFVRLNNHSVSAHPIETVKVSALSSDIEDSSIGLQRLEKKIREYESKLHLQKEHESTLEEKEAYNELIINLEEKIEALEKKVEDMNATPTFAQIKSDEYEGSDNLPTTSFPSLSAPQVKKIAYYEEEDVESVTPKNNIHIDSFKGINHKARTSANYIPAGTYVKALLIQGIDASASTTSQTDPRPVLMRLTSNGSLPNEVSGHIEDCRLIGAAYGDISSERAFIRLESMSCTLKSRNIIESLVDGYIVGEDGKAGIRGVVVRREADLLTNSFFSGLASGLGSGLSESFDRDLVSPLGVVRETKSSDVFKKAGAQGMSNSFDRLSKYYIERAEQFQPVIQIGAGREVDVVFKKGFHLHEGSQPLVLAQDK